MPSARLIGIGVFVAGSLALFAFALFMVGDRRLMFADQFQVTAEFADIAGLQVGAPVRVGGMEGGEVVAIAIPGTPSARFRVRMRIREDLRQLVRTDSVASIQTDGFVGNRYVRIEPGSEEAAVVAEGGRIRGQEPFDFADVLERASKTVDEIGGVVLDVRADLQNVLTTVAETATNATDMVETIGPEIEAISRAGRRIAEDTRHIVEGVRAGRGTLGKLVNDDEVYQHVRKIAQEAEQVATLARESMSETRAAITDIRGRLTTGEHQMGALVDDLRVTVASARDAMSDLAENTEALKRNFFFRGYFNERGYYDLNDLTAADYRQGVLAGRYREPIRLWLRADLLFEPEAAADGETANAKTAAVTSEGLSVAGRMRLDRAMAEILRYPRNTPLVIEGYAVAPTRDERFVRSAERARLVRNYLIAKYGLSPNDIGIVPLGQPEGGANPQGDPWDGVALTAWVDRRVFATRDDSH